MSPYLLAALILIAAIVVLALSFWLARRFALNPQPKILVDAETEAWSKLEELLEFAASSKSDQKAIAAAQQRIAQRSQRVADFKAKAAAL